MKLLRQTIRKMILAEIACDGANAKIQQGLNEIERRDFRVQTRIETDESEYSVSILNARGGQVGRFDVVFDEDDCCAYTTDWTTIDDELFGTGIGAVMYDIAVETATRLGKYLACDRISVSEDALPMWRYYSTSDDYEALQMDTEKGDFTPNDPNDDCKQLIFHRVTNTGYTVPPDNYKGAFMSSPYTKAYRKKRITTIPCLGDRYKEI